MKRSPDISIIVRVSGSRAASARNASASADVNSPVSADSASRLITGSTSATRGLSRSACFDARICAARQTSPSEPSTVSGATASTLFNAAMALTGPASRDAVAAVKAASVE